MSVNRLEGKIDWFDANKGFGIIKCEGDEVFIHHSGIQSNTDNYKVLYENEEVEFEISEDNTGRLCATKVTGSGGTKLQFENSTPSYKKQSKNKKKVRNTESFAPSHIPADLKVIVGNPSNETLDMKLDSRDFVLISSLFEDDDTMYDTLLEEIQQSGIDEQELWKLWHGDSHLIADDHLEWKKSCPTFQKIIDRISKYFEMEPKSTRLNWYENSDQWKPYHHDAAAIKPHIAKNQNLTVGISFGATREIAFEHAETKAIVSFPLPNGTVYAFGNDVNSTWKHGIPQIPEENRNNDGRISIIVWGWSDEQ